MKTLGASDAFRAIGYHDLNTSNDGQGMLAIKSEGMRDYHEESHENANESKVGGGGFFMTETDNFRYDQSPTNMSNNMELS